MQGSSPVGIIIWLLSLKVRTPASQAGNDGFKSRRSYCGYKTMAVRQIVALLTGAQDVRGTSVLRRPKRSVDRLPLVTLRMGMPRGEGSGLYIRHTETPQVRVLPHPLSFACPSGLWCHPAKVVCGNAPKVQILPQTL